MPGTRNRPSLDLAHPHIAMSVLAEGFLTRRIPP
jgi:hypothetical protein